LLEEEEGEGEGEGGGEEEEEEEEGGCDDSSIETPPEVGAPLVLLGGGLFSL
jgi:hypothetical protein